MINRPRGMLAFTVVIAGQIVSLLGTGMTQFALSIWAWEKTGQATALALVAFFGFGPTVFFSPIAGALVDRWNRRMVMMLSDLAAGASTVVLFALLLMDNLQIWHLYVAAAFSGIFQAFQWPAYSAAVTLMVPKSQYARANGLMSLAGPASNIFAPILAGALFGFIGLDGIMLIDIVTFTAAIGTLLVVFIPQPKATEEGEAGRGSLWKETLYGFRYIVRRRSLLLLQSLFTWINLTASLGFTVVVPMILARTGENELVLGTVMSIGSVGGLAGGLLLSVWGGPKRLIHGVLLGFITSALFSQVLLGLGRDVALWSLAMFMGGLIIPVLNGSNQAIWQSKVAPDVQGRVFSVRRWIAQISAPLAMLAAGPLADKVFEPAMMPDGALAPIFSWLVGVGPGAGMGLMFVIFGLLGVLAGVLGYLLPEVRNVEDILPDHEAEALPEAGLGEAPVPAESGAAS